MSLHLVPLRLDDVAGAAPVWLPFIERIAVRAKADPAVLIGNVVSGDVHLVLVWDSEEKRAQALAGIRFVLRGSARRFEIVWLTGHGRETWAPLYPELERYLQEHQQCSGGEIVCRPGWAPTLKTHGYRVTHLTLEKDF